VIAVRICYLANASSVHTRRWVRYFVERGHEAHVISFENARIEGTTVHVLKLPVLVKNATFALKMASIHRIKALIKKIEPDILHAHYVTNYGLFGALCNFNPFVITAWGSDVLNVPEARFISMIKVQIAKYALRKADLITCNGESMRKEINGLGVSLQNIRVIYWGTDVQKFKPRHKNKEIKSKLGILNSPTIISLRNLEPVYKSLNVSDSVRFVGWISHDKLPQYLASSDIYVSTSLSDGGLSSSTKEAMACELPVVVTDLMVNRQWIQDGTNGFIVPIKDPKSLADKIITLLKDEDLRIKFGKNGRNMVKNKLNFYKEMEKVESIYEGLMNR